MIMPTPPSLFLLLPVLQLSAQLRAVQQTAGQLAEQAAHTASDLQAAASQSSLAHGELESIGASLGYSSLPPGIFQPPAAPSAAAGDSSAAGVALAAAVSAAAQQGVDRSPLAANTAVLQAAVTAMASEAEQLRQRVYAGQLEEQQLAQGVQGLEDSVAALRFAVTGSTNALTGERRRIADLTRQIAADKASLKKVADSNAAAQAALAKAEVAIAALNARVDKLQRRKGGLERDVVKWTGMADDMDAVEEAKAQQAKDSAAAKNL
jgi:predicted  nucleic acid-binding Zn-ribbon protein